MAARVDPFDGDAALPARVGVCVIGGGVVGVMAALTLAQRGQAVIRASWMALDWSASGAAHRSHYHCTTEASNSAVGVSALYSKSSGGPVLSQRRSMRP